MKPALLPLPSPADIASAIRLQVAGNGSPFCNATNDLTNIVLNPGCAAALYFRSGLKMTNFIQAGASLPAPSVRRNVADVCGGWQFVDDITTHATRTFCANAAPQQ